MTYTLETGPEDARLRLILAHGAGTGITSPFMDAVAANLAAHGVHVTRFEFGYMNARREGGAKRPPPKAEGLIPEYAALIAAVTAAAPKGQKHFIGGKSMGGRVASMMADEAFGRVEIAGLVCLGYPFHAPSQSEKMRTAHLEKMTCPTLIVQGERDPFGNKTEIEAVKLSNAIQLKWIGDGDHDFGPRGASGFTRKGNLNDAADAVAAFMTATAPSR